MLTIGCHLSSSRGYLAMGKEAVKINANTFQFFTRNPRGAKAKDIDPEDVAKFFSFAKEHGIEKILAHAPYTLNACSADEGSHVKQGVETGIAFIAEMLNSILKPEQTTTVLLETMSGKGSEVGSRFEELREIIDRIELSDHLGVCLDTCHIWDGGYDIVNHLDEVLTEFDRVIGLSRLRAIHLNDSLNPLGAHKDRHARIGEGYIGAEALIRVVQHPALKHLPFYLETPNDPDGYAAEIALMREHAR